MEEITPASLPAKSVAGTLPGIVSTDAPDHRTPWLSNAQAAMLPQNQNFASTASTTEKNVEYRATGKRQSIVQPGNQEGEKPSQASTIGVSGISEDSEISTLLSGGEPALGNSDSDQQKTETSVVSETVPDASRQEDQDATAQDAHPTLLERVSLRAGGRECSSTLRPWNINQCKTDTNERSQSNPLKQCHSVHAEITTTRTLESGQEGLQKRTTAPPREVPPGSHSLERSGPRYSKLFLLSVSLFSRTLTREKKQRPRPPPRSPNQRDGYQDVTRGTKQAVRGAVGDFRGSLLRKSKPQISPKDEIILTDRRRTERRQKEQQLFPPCGINYLSCLASPPLTRANTHIALCDERGSNRKRNSETQYAAAVVPLTVDACLGSRHWITSLYNGVWAMRCAPTCTARGRRSPPRSHTRVDGSPRPEQADSLKNRGYNGKWKCPLMPSNSQSQQ